MIKYGEIYIMIRIKYRLKCIVDQDRYTALCITTPTYDIAISPQNTLQLYT